MSYHVRVFDVCFLGAIIVIYISSGGAVNPHHRQRNVTDLSAAVYPVQCPDGSLQHSIPAGHMCPFKEDALVSTAGGGNGISPLPVFTVGLLALLWVWILDEAILPARLRREMLWRIGGKGGCQCRCRVCTLRIQARGQPLHDVREVA